MEMYFKLAMVGLTTIAWAALDTEPQCYSRFDYEYKVLKKLIELENAQKEQRVTNEALLLEIEILKKASEDKSSALEEFSAALKGVSQSVDGLLLEVEGMQQKGAGLRKDIVVASSARLSKTLSHLQAGQTIVFDNVILNEGEGYNVTSGVFTCPRAGVYLITFSLGIRGVVQFFGNLMVNGLEIISATVEGQHSAQDLIGGNTIAIGLNINDRVWVQQSKYSSDKLGS